MRDEFYIILPSNSSMQIYPANTTSHYTTYLPQQLDLNNGPWSVAATEVILPMTFKHLQEGENITLSLFDGMNVEIKEFVCSLSSGIYASIEKLLEEINSHRGLSSHLLFARDRGGVVHVKLVCDENCQKAHYHRLVISKSLQKIFGFSNRIMKFKARADASADDVSNRIIKFKARPDASADDAFFFDKVYGKKPAHLSSNMPNLIMIYSDILEPCVVGDVQARLLRTVPLSFENYAYGVHKVKNFSSPLYMPLLYTSFRSIEIDFRDQFGDPVPFDSGTSSVTLHFKRF